MRKSLTVFNFCKKPWPVMWLMVWLGVVPVKAQFFYGLHQEFGKNRVEYNRFDWNFYRFEKMDVYFYKSSEAIARKAAEMAHRNLNDLERSLDSPIQDRISILVFNNLSELKQSNLIASDEDAYNTGGVTHISGNKMFLYFDGSYANLEGQMRSGMAELLLNNLIYGSFAESFKNSTLLNFPEWYFEGLISHLSGPMNAHDRALLVDGFAGKRFKRFNSLTGEDARVAGHSIWDFIAANYGKKVIRNVLYMAVVNRNVDAGFRYILGSDLKQIMQNWNLYYQSELQRTQEGKKAFKDLPGDVVWKSRHDERISHLQLNAEGNKAVAVVNRQGRYRLKLFDIEKKKSKNLYYGGYRIPQNADYTFPLPAWHPNGRIIAFLTEEKGFLWLNFYDLEKKKTETKEFFKFDKVHSMQYSQDGKQLLMTASKNGQSDVYLYTILNTSIQEITQDVYDDFDAVFFQSDKRIVFRSNRPKESLEPTTTKTRPSIEPTFDLYVANRNGEGIGSFWRLSKTPNIQEDNLEVFNNTSLAYLSNLNGYRNVYQLQIDSSIAYIDTSIHYNYHFKHFRLSEGRYDIVQQAISNDGTMGLQTFLARGRYELRKVNLDLDHKTSVENSDSTSTSKDTPETPKLTERTAVILPPKEGRPKGSIDILNYQFHPKLTANRLVLRPKPAENIIEPATLVAFPQKDEKADSLIIPNRRNYFVSLYQDEFTTQIDNIFANPQYQPFTGVPSPNLLNAGFNMLFKVGVVDLFNNYRITAGLRTDFQPIPGLSLSPNAEFFIGLTDFSKRLDKTLMVYRRSRFGEARDPLGFPILARVITHEVTYKNRYPLNPVSSVEGSLAYRNDRGIALSTDGYSVNIPATSIDYGILRAAYIYDNTRKLGLNLHAGMRFKIFSEYYRNFSASNTGLHTAGIDFRQYTQVHRTIIWANRFAGGTSFGAQKLVHFLGGVDNQFGPQFDNSTPISQTENYVFQTLVTNMRGFFQNVRNGNSFAVLNSELRVPIFKYILNRPIRNDFIANFQIIGFGDVGTAWNGSSPWSAENALNNRIVELPPSLRIVVDRQKDPIVYGTGFGLRTRLLGYFMRADWAWGIEDGVVLPSVFYFSLSTDF